MSATIVSLISLAISIVSIFVTIINSVLQDRRRFKFEREKAHLEDSLKRTAELNRLRLAHIQEQAAILSKFLKALQKLKNHVVTLRRSSSTASSSVESFIGVANELVNDVISTYTDALPHFETDEIKALHAIKKKAGNLLDDVTQIAGTGPYVALLTPASNEVIQHWLDDISETIDELRIMISTRHGEALGATSLLPAGREKSDEHPMDR